MDLDLSPTVAAAEAGWNTGCSLFQIRRLLGLLLFNESVGVDVNTRHPCSWSIIQVRECNRILLQPPLINVYSCLYGANTKTGTLGVSIEWYDQKLLNQKLRELHMLSLTW